MGLIRTAGLIRTVGPNRIVGLVRAAKLIHVLIPAMLMLSGPVLGDGAQTGVIIGTVSDLDGVAVQGVEVRLTGPQGSRRAITGTDGRFRFPALSVGSFGLRTELLELSAERTNVTVFAGRTTEAELVLRATDESEPAVEDWIQVVGDEAPLVDRYDTRIGANLSFELLDDLPVERFYQSFALLLPGVSGGQDGNPNTHGALRSQNLFLVDGVDTTDPTTGLFGLNLSYEAVQEVQVTTAVSGVEYGRVSGAVINVITRSGSREPHGLARWVVGGDDWASDYRVEPDRANLALELNTANSGRSDLDSTLSLAGGGPLISDRLWLFAAHQDSSVGALRPTLVGESWNADSDVRADAAKLTWQAAPQHTVVLQYAGDDARFTAFEPFSRGPSELELPEVPGSGQLGSSFFQNVPGESFALGRRRQRGSFSKLQWDAAFGQSLSVSLNLADQDRQLTREALASRGLTENSPHVGAFVNPAAPTGEEADNLFLFLFNGVTEQGVEDRPRRQGNLSVDLFQRAWGADHEMRFGFDYQETESEVDINVPGVAGLDPFTGRPVSGQLYVDFDFSDLCLVLQICVPFDASTGAFKPVSLFNFYDRDPRRTQEKSTALYWADSIVLDHWLFYVGVRWESVTGENGDGDNLVDDSDFAPRLAVTYDLGAERKTVLSASWSRFHEGFLHQYLDAYRRLEPLSGYTEYELLDSDTVPGADCSGVTEVDLSSPCWRATEVVEPLFLLPAATGDPVEQTTVDEWTLGLETRLGAHSSLGIHWVDRQWKDLWNGIGRFLPAEDRVFVEVRNLPEAERSYQALQVLFQKRRADRWQLLASYTWSDAEGNFFTDDGLDTFADFGDLIDTNQVNRRGPAPYDRPHQVGIFGSYNVPFGGAAQLTLGTAVTYRDGVPFQFESTEPAGVRFLTPRGSSRLSGEWRWDLAADLQMDLASWATFELRAEVRNLTDEQSILSVETLVDSGAPGLPTGLADLQSPRAFRLTLGLRF